MKTWVLIPLVVFIAVAGYQFGYYRAKLESSEADKVRVADAMEQQTKPRAANDHIEELLSANVIGSVEAAETALPTLSDNTTNDAAGLDEPGQVEGVVSAVMEGSESRKQMQSEQSEWADNFDESEQDFEAATQLADFFTLHPEGENVYLHSIQCDEEQCQLIGQFEGSHQVFEDIINEMKQQPWWEYSGTSSNTSSEGNLTHFILHLSTGRRS